MSKSLEDTPDQRAQTVVGTFTFMAPEVFYGEYLYEADVYSLGITMMYTVGIVQSIYQKQNREFSEDDGVRMEIYANIVEAMTETLARNRISAAEALEMVIARLFDDQSQEDYEREYSSEAVLNEFDSYYIEDSTEFQDFPQTCATTEQSDCITYSTDSISRHTPVEADVPKGSEVVLTVRDVLLAKTFSVVVRSTNTVEQVKQQIDGSTWKSICLLYKNSFLSNEMIVNNLSINQSSESIYLFHYKIEYPAGKYRIGNEYWLEAFPRDKCVRPRASSKDQDQMWIIEPEGDGFYTISCNTRSKGVRYLEAYPRYDSIRPEIKQLTQDQKWFFIEAGKEFKTDHTYVYILCNSASGGIKAMEAFPIFDEVRPRQLNNSTNVVDQHWFIVPW